MPNEKSTHDGHLTNWGSHISSTNTFGDISLLNAVDTAKAIEFPVQRGYSSLEITPEDLADTLAQIDSTFQNSTLLGAKVIPQTSKAIIAHKKTTTQAPPKVEEPKKKSFTEFNEQVLRINYTKVGDIENGWMFWAFLLCFIVYSITKAIFHRQSSPTFSQIFNYNFAQKEFHKSSEKTQIATIIFQVLYAFNIGLFGFFGLQYYLHWNIDTWQAIGRTGAIASVVLVLFFVKKSFYILISHIYDGVMYARECVFSVYLFNRAIGICLFPILISLAFVDPEILKPNVLLIIGYILIGTLYILRLYREFQISLKNHISIFYIFLYLCTLEILPLMVLVKVFTSIVFPELKVL